MKFLLDILRGVVIGVANLIPGVSGGTMMVSMGIYDRLIHAITHLFKEFVRSVKTLLPYVAGMLLAIVVGAFGLKKAFAEVPLPTNFLFIGLILGSLPMILKQMKGTRTGPVGAVIFVLFFAAVVVLKVIEGDNRTELGTGFGDILLYFVLGCISSATMVIPGVSGSMILKTLGYYEPIVTDTLTAFLSGLKAGDWAAAGHCAVILLPFAAGIVVGIFGIAKLIEALMKRAKGWTYCGILGMVLASPVVILMDTSIYAGVNAWLIAAAVAAFAAGLGIALWMGHMDAKQSGLKA